MKIYVDNNILSAIIGNQFTVDDGNAMQKLALSDHEFITSQITKQEMDKATVPKIKGAALFIYKIFGGEKFLNKETYSASGFGDALFGAVPWGGGEAEQPSLSLLRQAFEPDDARHIFQALSSHSDFFLTLDEKTILKRYRSNYMNMQAFCTKGKLKIVNPKELIKELQL
ncbi:hypothetical protein A3K34_02550 [candidate division WWE3 bacterium RIFOXYC1_FULL_40_10]|uniref:PIN domain-containing protein n=1 Tax=candidate division WWE3 bacterium RIFOXYA2_FULL_46_9 TaxID=1802636 RepID=A0A1F4W2S2_UNCKA|nr:MAG: hypothetical protein A3K58_02550 [candidate division WWE3 bacterium RIFOXYB1_FULL_40_22]OGC61728.1 MAG: hypothetical protein A3K37_02550 [candidate division WWE3 bacterium RIFOXYA1_FULL_40_11]OGC63712.1 MAG: hypothetical protein A2264_05040 [candidate division WWE3 bacterium RIFOXYA2_FULL_46_9]OGC65119.1 MAG: hypothetical protein A2326_00975 [candidate division WWE3 bacterium RIFOXYB2_FULL_41_6]OGC66111.1 MAG: hypothetical protein A3K34_02550 [candidate division WWE3 bacterium RIFOXYC1_